MHVSGGDQECPFDCIDVVGGLLELLRDETVVRRRVVEVRERLPVDSQQRVERVGDREGVGLHQPVGAL